MAKRAQKSVGEGLGVRAGKLADGVLTSVAEDLGRILGVAQAKATAWLDHRQAITQQLAQIRDTATQLIEQLGGGRRGGRPKATSSSEPKPRRKKKRTMSPEARAKISEAQRKRWARQKKSGE